MKEAGKTKALAIVAGVIAVSLIAVTQANKVKDIYVSITQPEVQDEITECQESKASTFQSLIEEQGVVLTKGSISIILAPPVANSVDAVTSATPLAAQASD